MNTESLVEFLATVEIFSTLSPAELERLSAQAESKTYDFGETVFNAGDRGEGLFVIRSGTVRIFTERQGKEISMGVRKQGEVFAEVAAIGAKRGLVR